MKKKTKNLLGIVIPIIVIIVGLILYSKISYKMPYSTTVFSCSREHNINPYLIYSIIKSESNFDENALSHKGAIGLMQLTEETGMWAAQKAGIEIENPNDLYNPETNIKIGSWYLAYLLDQLNGNLTNTLCAYNAGITNVRGWLNKKEYSFDGQNLSVIPFPETEKYVKKVYKNYNKYKSIYEK